MDSLEASNQFHHEVCMVIERYSKESDLSVWLMVGALASIQKQLLESLDKPDKKRNEN